MTKDAQPIAWQKAWLEAAEIAEEWDSGWGEDRNTKVARQTAIEIAAAIRSRAANRSAHGKVIPDCPTEGIAARQGNGA